MSTEIHAAGDAPGRPVRLIGTPGQRNDIVLAHDSIEGFDVDPVIADKGHDADHLVDTPSSRAGAEVVIPPRCNRKVQRSSDKHLYPERDAIERSFCKPKQFRRVATRYDKLLATFKGFVKLAIIAIWVR